MNTTVEALQALYVSKGGNLSDVENITTIPEMIDALADFQVEQEQPVTQDEVTEIINTVN